VDPVVRGENPKVNAEPRRRSSDLYVRRPGVVSPARSGFWPTRRQLRPRSVSPLRQPSEPLPERSEPRSLLLQQGVVGCGSDVRRPCLPRLGRRSSASTLMTGGRHADCATPSTVGAWRRRTRQSMAPQHRDTVGASRRGVLRVVPETDVARVVVGLTHGIIVCPIAPEGRSDSN